ncbi:hypothetical protein JBE27_02845 [Streptomyces albiflaviniger]|nr:hypothetical protein [Streptomyces albiflaviniger]
MRYTLAGFPRDARAIGETRQVSGSLSGPFGEPEKLGEALAAELIAVLCPQTSAVRISSADVDRVAPQDRQLLRQALVRQAAYDMLGIGAVAPGPAIAHAEISRRAKSVICRISARHRGLPEPPAAPCNEEAQALAWALELERVTGIEPAALSLGITG